MEAPLKTRSQRRLEKRQAVTILILVLAVALGSFTLGVMVGNRGSDRSEVVATEVVQAPEVQVAGSGFTPPTQETEEPPEDEGLSFYDRLPQGEPPLGSGINLPPEPAVEQAAVPPMEQPPAPEAVAKPEPAQPDAQASQAAASSEPTSVPAPESTQSTSSSQPSVTAIAKGGYAVQVASLKTLEAASGLEKKLATKGYPAFTVEAMVKQQRYYRVMVGPFDKSGASRADKQSREKEKINGFVKRI